MWIRMMRHDWRSDSGAVGLNRGHINSFFGLAGHQVMTEDNLLKRSGMLLKTSLNSVHIPVDNGSG
jgi:hypothetical protein